MLVNAAYAKIEVEFDYWFDIMRTENLAMCDWTNRLEYDKHQFEYTVVETTPAGNFLLGMYRVSLRDRTYDCEYFQALYYPCCHAIACCAQSWLDWATYVHEVYTMSKVFSVYRMRFLPHILEGLWPLYAGPTIVPDPNMRRARERRPRSTRFRNTMDEADTSWSKRCGLYRQTGHTRRTCPQ
ncbi:uncharacterized protein LOC107463722 [Arachis duranensis]|uniref:Uncharacterized protein LOC107463722 n=1 Tax=Arachis duranensis TaxID=130453 RepID=A0A6P4BI49_ARADU|nr:uncharacterized protein LOC107463722 [Arachis duranensis]